jgi:antitoxin component YwqK of YwqJK toxin-antitoxin module
MKTLVLIFLLLNLIPNSSFSQSSMALDGKYPNTRFWMDSEEISIANDFKERLKQLLYRDSLKLTPEIEKDLKNGPYRWNLDYFEMDYCYLMDEKESWLLRTYRTIDLNDPANVYFTKGSRTILNNLQKDGSLKMDTLYDSDDNLYSVILNGLKQQHLTAFQFSYFEYDTSFNTNIVDKFDSIWPNIEFIKIKEDWSYNIQTGELENFPVGLGLTNSEGKDLLWFYFPELSHSLFSKYVNFDFRSDYNKSWKDILENHWYKTKDIVLVNHINKQGSEHLKYDYNTHRNDFHSLLNIELVKEHIQNNYINYTGTVLDTLSNKTMIKGQLINGLIQGEWKFLDKTGMDLVVMNFVNNVAHGSYESNHQNHSTNETGTFEMGLKTGEWNSYFVNSKLMAKRNYRQGWLEGKQQVWFESGKKHMEYHYENFELNGAFKRWNTDQKMTENGYFKNDKYDGVWKINLKIPMTIQKIISLNPDINWCFERNAQKDGYFTYSATIEQYNDPHYCFIPYCIKQTEISKIK